MKQLCKKKFIVMAALCVATVVSTGYLLMLGWYNTLSLDDYGFAVDMKDGNPFSWAYQMYMTWQGRFSTFFVSGIIFKLWGYALSLFSWTVVHLLLGYCSTSLLLSFVLSKKDTLLKWLLAILVTNITICSVFEISTFYWLCCAGYFLVIYATMVLIYLLFFHDVNTWVKWIGSVLCAMYIGGSAENYTPVVLMVLGIIWLWQMWKECQSTHFKTAMEKNSMLFVTCAILGIEFLVMVMAPGNKVRLSHGEEISGFMYNFEFLPFIKKSIIANAIFGMRLLSRLLYFIAALPIFIWIGHYSFKIKTINKAWYNIMLSFIALVAVIVISVTACVFGIGYYPPLRAMGFVMFLIMAWVGYVGVLIGNKLKREVNLATTGIVVASILWIFYFGYYWNKEQPYAKEYSNYVHTRDAYIQQQGNSAETLVVENYVAPEWSNTYSIFRTTLYRCLGKKRTFKEPYFPYMISDIGVEPDFRSWGISSYYMVNCNIVAQ